MKMEKINQPRDAAQFLKTVLVDELNLLIEINPDAPYLKFLLILNGIEFLGACLDNKQFEDHRLSKKRFLRGLRRMGNSYHNFDGSKMGNVNFYSDFRSPMVHQLRPDQSKIRLTSKDSIFSDEDIHLSLDDQGRLVIVLEHFYNDFKFAVQGVISKINSGELKLSKLKDPHITIERIKDLYHSS